MSNRRRSEEDKTGALIHVVGLMGGFIGTFLFYLLSDNDYLKEHAAKATNWQATLMMHVILISLLGLGNSAIFLLFALNFGFSTIATKKALDGEAWKYPLSLKLLNPESTEESTNYEGEAKNKIERIKTLYQRGIIDEDEMEKRIEDELQFEYDNQDDENKSQEVEFSKH